MFISKGLITYLKSIRKKNIFEKNSSHTISSTFDKHTSDLKFDKTVFESLNGTAYVHLICIKLK